MSSNDYIMIAGRIRAALEQKKSFTLPLMTMADLAHVLTYLKMAEAAA